MIDEPGRAQNGWDKKCEIENFGAVISGVCAVKGRRRARKSGFWGVYGGSFFMRGRYEHHKVQNPKSQSPKGPRHRHSSLHFAHMDFGLFFPIFTKGRFGADLFGRPRRARAGVLFPYSIPKNLIAASEMRARCTN